MSYYPFVLHEISVLTELILGHLCYRLTDVPPQPNSPPDYVLSAGRPREVALSLEAGRRRPSLLHPVSEITLRVAVFQWRVSSRLLLRPPSHFAKSD